jgi:hypothetical protein
VDHKTNGHTVGRAHMYIKHWRNKQVRKTTKGTCALNGKMEQQAGRDL